MKKLTLSILVISLIFISNVYSQFTTPPCSYTCPYSTWTYITQPGVPLPTISCPNCTIIIGYWYRVCDGNIEIALGPVTQVGDCSYCEDWIIWFAAD